MVRAGASPAAALRRRTLTRSAGWTWPGGRRTRSHGPQVSRLRLAQADGQGPLLRHIVHLILEPNIYFRLIEG